MKNDSNCEIRVRKALVSDAGAISRLNQAGLGYGLDIDGTTKRLEQVLPLSEEWTLVALVNGEIAGYIEGTTYECIYTEKLVDVLALAVDPEKRRLGVGEALMQYVEDWAKEQGAVGVRLISRSDRLGAHQFYEACGYHKKDEYISFKKLF